MERSSQDAEIPMPINSVYGGANHHHLPSLTSSSPSHHHHHTITHTINSNGTNGTNSTTISAHNLEEVPYNNRESAPQNERPRVRYRECQKNHAASMGGNATDGCGEFMPSGDHEDSLESLTCSVCNCHRNFHRREIDGGGLLPPPPPHHGFNYLFTPHHLRGRKVILGAPNTTAGGGGALGGVSSRAAMTTFGHPQLPYTTNFHMASDDQSDDPGRDYSRTIHHPKKRFRTKFSQEQKDKMLKFAEKVGWKIQRQEEGVIQRFCEEVGVKRRVLKVWMHNNKHTLAKKSTSHDPNTN